jgi:hypothetical protein
MSVLDYDGGRQQSNVTGIAGGSPDTGEMRRKYNFAEQFTELAIDQTPFFRIVSKIGTKPTDDPQFKFTEKRQSWMKRYGYCLGFGTAAADLSIVTGALTATIADDEDYLYMGTDYLSAGNKQNIIGQTGKSIGDVGTRPEFYLENQVIKINVSNTAGGDMDDYKLFQILKDGVAQGWVCHTVDSGHETANSGLGAVGDFTPYATGIASATSAANFYEVSQLKVKQVKDSNTATVYLMGFNSSTVLDVSASPTSNNATTIAANLEPRRSYVVGTSYQEGSTLMEANWGDQPYSTGFGYTQIWRSEFGMTNTARATALKYEKNEWARLWRDKLIEHKWEIEQTALFGSQAKVASVNGNTHYYTQGAVDYVLSNGNLFNLDLSTKIQDDFLGDLSQLVDPRYNNSKSMMFFCDTATYNWLHKLGGYFNNNLEMSTNHQASFAVSGKKKSFGVDFTTISTVYGDINVARNIHLDGSGIKILGVNMNYVKWRPLAGNGINRSTSVYVGVQNLENTGTDKRVDMILTEGGFEFSMPECHALWK